MTSVPPAKKKSLLIKLIVGVVVLGVVAAFLLRGVDLQDVHRASDRFFGAIRTAGPVAFFAAMAILPAFGAPMMAFTIPAGEAFAAQLTLPGVIAIAMFAAAVNIAFAYWVAKRLLRPWLTSLVKKFGYEVPQVSRENALTMLLIVRLTPGPPYFVQCWLLALSGVPFGLYMIVSWLCLLPWLIGAVVLGQGIFTGNFKSVVGGLGLLIVAVVAVQLIRQRMKRKNAPAH
ncbi:VTT domain-containing protein [Horticoccus luteus]|uniref:TVP38/TMEM64 family membrane protein n=1 Tax=Horticoccus luteus TaxID=2862869 RepID=A0A8F9TUS5_9BACT|nr:VTT domain-containing protein [Horticoccus luteus]QYM78673.1 VTT domain-containing protein [Horticoccus luteus]